MASSANTGWIASSAETSEPSSNYVFGRNLRKIYVKIKSGEGNYIITEDNRKIFDACSGAAVSCLGHGNPRVIEAITKQLKLGIPYLSSAFWGCEVVDDLCKELILGTDKKMARAYLTGSGSEAMEAAIKLSCQYFYAQNQKTRVNFISRERSYHGNTIGALSVSEFLARKKPYSPLLMKNIHHISSCYQYRQQKESESDSEFVARKAAELENKFQELGPDTIIGFIAEPIVGAALGCVSSPPGYLQAMRDVCHKHGALFILDEVMCGMGRTGTLHAWQAENVVPDIQTMAKGLGGGYEPIAAMLVSEKVVKVIKETSGEFIHGLTFQSMPVQAVAALEIQRIIKEDRLMENVTKQGKYLGEQLKNKLTSHPNVGDIRGRGLFWGLEFVKNKETKDPFDPNIKVAYGMMDLAVSSEFNITIYPATGTVDGIKGDHIILAPAYIVTKEDVDYIVTKVCALIDTYFSRLEIK